jgi:hypothetical protein
MLFIIFYFVNDRIVEKRKDAITYNDALLFDSTKMKAEEYFNIKHDNSKDDDMAISHNKVANHVNDNNQHITITENNTSRALNTIQNEDNNDISIKKSDPQMLKLHDNHTNRTSEINNNNQINNSIVVNNNFVNKLQGGEVIKQEINAEIKPFCITSYAKPTYNDYQCLDAKDSIQYDKRETLFYIRDDLVIHHSFISTFFKWSIIEPYYIRLTKFIMGINMIFAFNAFALFDNNIDLRAIDSSRVTSAL